MNKNKGIIGMGLILAIVLGIAVVGGGAYYLGKGSNQEVNKIPEVSEINSKVDDIKNIDIKPVEQTKPFVDNNSTNCTPNSTPSIKVISPNGGETYTAGQKINVKWESCNFRSNAKGVNISVVWAGNLEALSFPIASGSYNDGQELIILPSIKEIKDFETNTFKVHVQMNIIGQNLTVNGDGSDNTFTIKSSEESSTESFKNQPGEVKSVKLDGNNKWVLAVDLLSSNPNWLPGVYSSGPFFLNQNTKIRNLNLTNLTKAYNCGGGSSDNNQTSVDVFIKDIQSSEDKTRYFDIEGANILAIYEQCLP